MGLQLRQFKVTTVTGEVLVKGTGFLIQNRQLSIFYRKADATWSKPPDERRVAVFAKGKWISIVEEEATGEQSDGPGVDWFGVRLV